MRDVLLTLIVVGLLPFIVRRPVLGAYSWAWLSMMNPHQAVYGFARSIPFAYLLALATLIGMMFSRERKPLPITAITVQQFVLLAWMTLTSYFAMNETSIVTDRWIFVMKIQVMIFATWMLVRGRRSIDLLIWVVTFSVGFYGVKGGIWTVMTGGGGRVWGPAGGMIEGNNELAVALIMLLPLMFYLYQTSKRKLVRMAIGFSMITTAFAILGSQSRGALLGLCAIAFYLAVKSRYPIRMSIAVATVLACVISFMPDTWTARMETMQAYQGEGSAMSRIYAWKTLWAAAVDRPVVGAGFAADTPIVFHKYAPMDAAFEGFEGRVWVAHSIYFQMLGEHGFPGLAIFLLLGIVTWRTANRLTRQTRGDPEFGTWVPILMPMLQVSMIGYAVGGAFLSLAYFDLPYYIVSCVVLVDMTIRERRRARENEHAAPGIGAGRATSPALPESSS
jgi:probable O-glycosylation ligase (exosortase A-associated)